MSRKNKITFAITASLFLLVAFVTQALAFGWGADWKPWNKCPQCGKWFKHVGVDIFARAGRNVYFDGVIDGTVRRVYHDPTFFWCVVIENKTHEYTWVIWHLDKVPVKEGAKVGRKTKIGVVADFPENVSPDHIHLGMRHAAFDDRLSLVGALPACTHQPKRLPQFPENFAPPNEAVIIIQ